MEGGGVYDTHWSQPRRPSLFTAYETNFFFFANEPLLKQLKAGGTAIQLATASAFAACALVF